MKLFKKSFKALLVTTLLFSTALHANNYPDDSDYQLAADSYDDQSTYVEDQLDSDDLGAYSDNDGDTLTDSVDCETGGTDHKGRKTCYPKAWLKASFGHAIDVSSVKVETIKGLGSDWSCDAAKSLKNKDFLQYAHDPATGRNHLVAIKWQAMTWSGHCWGCRGIIRCKYSAKQYKP